MPASSLDEAEPPGSIGAYGRRMSEPVHEIPESIELGREEYRVQHRALEAALDRLDRIPEADVDGSVRAQVKAALRALLRKIWPYLEGAAEVGYAVAPARQGSRIATAAARDLVACDRAAGLRTVVVHTVATCRLRLSALAVRVHGGRRTRKPRRRPDLALGALALR